MTVGGAGKGKGGSGGSGGSISISPSSLSRLSVLMKSKYQIRLQIAFAMLPNHSLVCRQALVAGQRGQVQ